MDGHYFGHHLIAVLVGDHAVNLATIHVILHGISVSRSLIAGNHKGLCAGFFDIPLIGQAIALNLKADAELLANFLLYLLVIQHRIVIQVIRVGFRRPRL